MAILHSHLQKNVHTYDSLFLHQGHKGRKAFQEQMGLVVQKLTEVFSVSDKPFNGQSPQQVKYEVEFMMRFSNGGYSLEEALDDIEGPILKNSLHISHRKSIAHLHCPPLISGIAAELIIGALNQSMDSWDQSTAATYVEKELVRQLAEKAELPDTADGTFTSGGTQSNYMGLLLARDYFCHRNWNHLVQEKGLPPGFEKLRILCSEEAHFTVQKSAAQLGLGKQAVVTINTDDRHRMRIEDVEDTLTELKAKELLPFAIVATCGTTDYGSIDPLYELKVLARQHALWMHVDAAFGGGLLFSHNHRENVNGLSLADSITLDFHKLFYQPISCGLFLVSDRKNLRYLSYHADYLNPVEDEEEGISNLVNKSVQTTKRFDALKVLLTFKTVGTSLLGKMIDDTIEVAREAAKQLDERAEFLVENPVPELNTVVFRFQPQTTEKDTDELNRLIQQELLYQGKAAISKTSINGRTGLKFTLLNPRTNLQDIKEVINDVEEIGREIAMGGYRFDKCERDS
ncbi:pyridoxal phosphate-dependent decarboxylase family protein [Alteribacter keqinensis]|uniref:Aspartate aminotransferase family protein n=1 Tax=Alteribacter keqinensis TaxID=2483800 RepID=A0A3M7TZ74_9BACI|nr:aspartate aminotransferase family protein [Alteribacter keqinensis]RNA69735.1 aspartate aminotransferase family protein [Alteribacter keqinensis]